VVGGQGSMVLLFIFKLKIVIGGMINFILCVQKLNRFFFLNFECK
jgi:hypothetical protein